MVSYLFIVREAVFHETLRNLLRIISMARRRHLRNEQIGVVGVFLGKEALKLEAKVVRNYPAKSLGKKRSENENGRE